MSGAPHPKPEPRRKARKRPLRHSSEKRRLGYTDREHVRLLVEQRDRYCIPALMGAPGRCASPDGRRPRMEVHERKTRARGGSIYSLPNCLLTCQRHHDWIDGNQDEAHELGLLVHSWAPDPTEPLTPGGTTR